MRTRPIPAALMIACLAGMSACSDSSDVEPRPATEQGAADTATTSEAADAEAARKAATDLQAALKKAHDETGSYPAALTPATLASVGFGPDRAVVVDYVVGAKGASFCLEVGDAYGSYDAASRVTYWNRGPCD